MFGLQSVEAKYVSWMPGNLKLILQCKLFRNTEQDDEFVDSKSIQKSNFKNENTTFEYYLFNFW